jgi:UPF0176 protein
MELEILHNRKGRAQLEEELRKSPLPRRVASFYRYLTIPNPKDIRDELYRKWEPLGVLGRIYIAHEGINAQFSVPIPNWQKFTDTLSQWPATANLFLNTSDHYQDHPFIKLKIKVRRYIVTDGLPEDIFQSAPTARHLDPIEFHQATAGPDTIVVDVRNNYECETGRFEGAWIPKSERFSQVLPELSTALWDQKKKRLLLYCTGGIRCEKASAYLHQQGFEHVYQLRGGIINYLKTVQAEQLPSRFQGSLFVFDGRMAEPTVGTTIAQCYSCKEPYDIHSDCANVECHQLIIQCPACREKLNGCCSDVCLARFSERLNETTSI